METQDQFRYRIYTENKNLENICDILDRCFQDYTLFTGTGYWMGESEANLTIEIIAPEHDNMIEEICKAINRANIQQCCLVTIEQVKSVFITDR